MPLRTFRNRRTVPGNIRNIIGGGHRLHGTEMPGSLERLTAAPAAVADKSRVLPHILPYLYQIAGVGAFQRIQRLLPGDKSAVIPVLGQGTRHIVKGQEHIPGSVNLAGMACVRHFMTEVA